jgi:chemotaxis protein CheD
VLTPKSKERTAATLPLGHPAEPVYVPPGRLLASSDRRPLTTIVSSGAVVCVWDPISCAGGMAHFLLPESGTAQPAHRFGDVALRTLVEELVKLGAPEHRLRARIFGGSAPPIVTEAGHLGDRNVEAARSFLGTRSIAVWEADVGGTSARKIVFSPEKGAASVARVGLN